MKTSIKISFLLTVFSVLFFACQKEVSYELGNTKFSVGALATDGSGGCLGAIVFGTFYKDSVLNTSHYANISVNVDTAGSYSITTDTVQGYYFSAKGNFNSTGAQVVKLSGKGKPLSAGTHIFSVSYNGTFCEFSVNVAVGTGGSSAFTVNCASAVPSGTYAKGVALTPANTVVLNVTVTKTGSWSISTAPAVNGVTFSGSGNFASTGAQTITLTASGTPVAAGPFNFPVNVTGTSCNFSITFTTIPDYFPRTTNSNWSYDFDGNFNDSLLIKVIPQTLTANGNTYNIFMFTDNAALGFDTSGYYRKSGSDYYEFLDMGSYIGLNEVKWMDFLFLKDNQTVGATWVTPNIDGTFTPPGGGTPVPVTLRWEFSIIQQNASVTVKGVSYPNTIEVKQELRQLVAGSWILAGYFKNFYSRDKGLIKQDLYDDLNVLQAQLDVRRMVIY